MAIVPPVLPPRVHSGWYVLRRVFEGWSIMIPASFDETFVHEHNYWHAYDEHRSVSLTSLLITDDRGPVGADAIVQQIPPSNGSPVDQLPVGLVGWAMTADAPQPAKASRILSGMLATDGRVLLVTITSDDLDWAREVWLSIQLHRDSLPQRDRRADTHLERGLH